MTIEEAFGVVIKDLRRKRGLRQIELAELTTLRRPTISDIERGRQGARLEVIFWLASALQVEADELLKRTSILYRDQRG